MLSFTITILCIIDTSFGTLKTFKYKNIQATQTKDAQEIISRNKETDHPSDVATMFALSTESNKHLEPSFCEMTVTRRYTRAFRSIRSILSVIARLMAVISVRHVPPRMVPPFYLLPVHEERPEDFRILRDHILRLARGSVFFDLVLGSLANGSSRSGVLVPRVRPSALAIRRP